MTRLYDMYIFYTTTSRAKRAVLWQWISVFLLLLLFFLEFAEIFGSFVMFLGMSDCMTFAPGSKRAVLRQWISAFSY